MRLYFNKNERIAHKHCQEEQRKEQLIPVTSTITSTSYYLNNKENKTVSGQLQQQEHYP